MEQLFTVNLELYVRTAQTGIQYAEHIDRAYRVTQLVPNIHRGHPKAAPADRT